jgi:hypothetical protein
MYMRIHKNNYDSIQKPGVDTGTPFTVPLPVLVSPFHVVDLFNFVVGTSSHLSLAFEVAPGTGWQKHGCP